jgi:tetratricopeptide (TPR) repeat protein
VLALLISLTAIAQGPAPRPKEESAARPTPAAQALVADEIPTPFVPLHPRTAEDRDALEVLRLYATARAKEDQGNRRQAITLLEQALKKDPESIAVLRRLSTLCLVSGRGAQGIGYARRVLELDPRDTVTIARLVDYYVRTNQGGGEGTAEAMLRKILDNPKVEAGASARLLALRRLGDIESERGTHLEKAADSYAKLVEALDTKAASHLSPSDQKLIVGDDEVAAYSKFGEVFFRTRRFELAARAFRRALVYDPDNVQLPLFLAEALLRAGKAEEALVVLEPFLRRQPQGREPYTLLVEILKALKRDAEILPRLEAAANADAKNDTLQYFLADHYRDAGQAEKADALLKRVLETRPDPQGFGRRLALLLEAKKYAEFIKELDRLLRSLDPQPRQALMPVVEILANRAEDVGPLLEAALKVEESEREGLHEATLVELGRLALRTKKVDNLIPIERHALKREPSAQGYLGLINHLLQVRRFEEAEASLKELFVKYPREQSPYLIGLLSQCQSLIGQPGAAIASARQAVEAAAKAPGAGGDPTELIDALILLGSAQARAGKNEEGIGSYKQALEAIEKVPDEDNRDKKEREVRLGLSIAYGNLERFDDAEKELEALYEKSSDDPGVNNDLGYLYADRGKNLEKAESMIRKALEDDPTNNAYLDSLGWVLFKRGKAREAVEPLEKASQGTDTDATIYDHLGDVYFKLKDLAKAKAAWEQARRVAGAATPPDKRLPEIKKKLESLETLPALPAGEGEKP